MKKISALFVLILILQLVGYSQQSLDDKIKEIDAYAQTVLTTHGGPGMAIAIVKDDKVVLAKGYGIRRLGGSVAGSPIPKSPTDAYIALYRAVKSLETDAIKATMSKQTQNFAEMVASRQNSPIAKVYMNGFTATTFAAALPTIRDQRIAGQFGAVEVWNAKDNRWEDLGFVLEDGGWKLAIGEMFAGTYKSPGMGQATREDLAKNGQNTPANLVPTGVTGEPDVTKTLSHKSNAGEEI